MLKLTVSDYYEKPKETEPEIQPVFEMDEVKEISFRNDKERLWYLNDEVKTLLYLQKTADPDEWVIIQKRIESLEFKIFSIFAWKRRSFNDKKFSKSAKEL
jgi:hypothetical protein